MNVVNMSHNSVVCRTIYLLSYYISISIYTTENIYTLRNEKSVFNLESIGKRKSFIAPLWSDKKKKKWIEAWQLCCRFYFIIRLEYIKECLPMITF